MILDFTRSPQACDVYDFDGNLISGGGGGISYVLPEQTVTVTDAPANLTDMDVSGIQNGDKIILKINANDLLIYRAITYDSEEEHFVDDEPYVDDIAYDILIMDDIWAFMPFNTTAETYEPGTYTVSAIKAF